MSDRFDELGSFDLDPRDLEHRSAEAATAPDREEQERDGDLQQPVADAGPDDAPQRLVARAERRSANERHLRALFRREKADRDDGIVGLVEIAVLEQRRTADRDDGASAFGDGHDQRVAACR